MVEFNRIDEPMKHIRDGMGHTAPIRDHGNAKRVFDEAVRGQGHSPKEDLDGLPFLMAVKAETVDGGIILVAADGFLSGLNVRGPQGLERALREDQPFAGQVAEEGFGDIGAHFQ